MNTTAWMAMLSVLSFPLFSQTQITGIINQYAKVSHIDFCDASIAVSDATLFMPGSHVLLVQMKGASINASNSSSFGNIEALGEAGLYEKNEVSAVSGNVVFLKFEPLNQYDVTGAVQLVTLPTFGEVEVVETLTASPWNGETGGILALEAEHLILSANVDVSGLGFRGASQSIVTSDCTFLTNADAYHYSVTNWRGSPKGEGIADLVSGKEHGRGAQANGGGGGNDHNSGGGGGANISAGGIGGKQSAPGFGCDGNYAGKGGKPAPNIAGRLFMGGGGGAGHVDDNGAGSPGGHGGGITIVLAQSITGNGFGLFANGTKPVLAHGDGAGGGGGGGTILVSANSISGNLDVEAKGGHGGDVQNNNDRCNGPGGGGSGGRLISDQGNFDNIVLEGGEPGVNSILSGECSGLSNGAEGGENGMQSNFISFPAANLEILAVEILEQPADVMACVGSQVTLTINLQGNNLDYQWQLNTGTGWGNVPNSSNYAGATTNALTITNPTLAMDGYQFRCLVTNICTPSIFSNESVLEVEAAPTAAFDMISLGSNSFLFQSNALNASSFLWNFGDGMTSTEENPMHVYSGQGAYDVTLVVTNICGQTTVTESVQTGLAPVAMFSASVVSGCQPLTVQFQNESTGDSISSYAWEFPGGTPSSSTLQSPQVTYSSPGIFPVKLTVTNAVGTHTLQVPDFIAVNLTPQAAFNFWVDGLTVHFTNSSIGGDFFDWDFGDGNSSQMQDPVHEFSGPGIYEVLLTVSNANCGSSISYQVYLEASATILTAQETPFLIFPNPATDHFTLQFKNSHAKEGRIRLYDSTGRIAQSIDFQKGMLEVELDGMPSGIYWVEISVGKRRWLVRQVKL